jgi:hypothetical protein
MNVRKLFLSGAFAALMGFVAIGCNENPIADPGNGPANLKASSTSATSVALSWDALSGATSYRISWTGSGAAGSGSVDNVTGTTYEAEGLTANAQYTFSVAANTADGLSDASTIVWAGADRFNETSTAGQKIRMYEAESTNPSGLNLFVNSAPRMVSLLPTATGAKAQLAMFIYPRTSGGTPDSIIVGPVYALTEYRVSAGNDFSRMDTNVFISGTTYQASSLDTWYLSQPLNQLIDPTSNVKAYKFTPATTTGQGFIVRTGTAGNYNYARVVIKALGNSLVQGSYPNRYVELEVSYQTVANLPYAKPGMRPAPIGVSATLGH